MKIFSSGNENKNIHIKQSTSISSHSDHRTKLSWLGVVGMGVAFSISGNFSGWNVGLGIGGWGGMFFAALIMALYYFCLTQCIAELAAASKQVDGMDSFAEMGLGAWGRFFTGISIALAVGLAVGAAVSFIEAYSLAVMGIGSLAFKFILVGVFSLIQLRGAKETGLLTTVGGGFSLLVLLGFCLILAPHFSLSGLYTQQDTGSVFILNGLSGIWLCIPYALFMFIGVEQAANAAGDMHEPRKNLPKSILTAVAIVLCIGLSVLLFSTAGDIHKVALANGDPLFVAIMNGDFSFGKNTLATAIGIGSIVSLLSTAFSLFYTSSRQFYSLGNSGFISSQFARQNKKLAPTFSIAIVAFLALVGSYIDPNIILVSFIFCLSLGNMLVLISFLVLRYKQPNLDRPYSAIGGSAAAIIALLLIFIVLIACAQLQVSAIKYIAIGYFFLILYFFVFKKGFKPNPQL